MSGSFNDFLNAVETALKDQFQHVRSCEVHPGQFSMDDLSKMATQCPAFRVALWDVGEFEPVDGGLWDTACRFSIAVITTEARNLPRHVAAVDLVNELALWLSGNDFNCPFAFPAQGVRAKNLFAGFSGKRVHLWEVTWTQTLRLGESLWSEEAPVQLEVYAGNSPKIGAAHEAEYEKVEPDAQ